MLHSLQWVLPIFTIALILSVSVTDTYSQLLPVVVLSLIEIRSHLNYCEKVYKLIRLKSVILNSQDFASEGANVKCQNSRGGGQIQILGGATS